MRLMARASLPPMAASSPGQAWGWKSSHALPAARLGQGAAMDVTDWLRALGLERYEATFRENDVRAEVLCHLTADDLKELGVATVGHRRELLVAIAKLNERWTPETVSPGVEPATSLGPFREDAVS